MSWSVSEEKRAYLRHVRELELDGDSHSLFFEFVSFLEKTEHHENHYFRYCQTFRALIPHLPSSLIDLKVLETGGSCPVTRFLAELGAGCRSSEADLRYSIDADTNSLDLVLSFEVVEHLKDQAEKLFDEVVLFQESGIRCYAAEVRRVLRPGGLFVLTTPNPCSTFALLELVAGRAPMVTREHVREYTREELHKLFDGLELVEEQTQYNFFYLTNVARERVEAVYPLNGWNAEHRGDDHFMVFRKGLPPYGAREPIAARNRADG